MTRAMLDERSDRPKFGTLLRQQRIAAGLSQEQLAERARISVQAVSALERGVRHAPRADTLELLVTTLDLHGADRERFEATARAAAKTKVRRTGVLPDRENSPDPFAEAPLFATSFVGRERERETLIAAIANERCVTVWGPGGVGKTRLAVESLRGRVQPGERLAFVPLVAAIDDSAVTAAFASALGVSEQTGSELQTQIVNELATQPTLLVIDNCEHVIAGAAGIVETLLRRVPDLTTVCTSREPLRIGAERVFKVEPLGTAASVQLFLDRSASETALSQKTDDDLRTIETICRRLDGIPLALELAAARTRAMGLTQIERGLDERFRLLTLGSRTHDARQQTLHGAIVWSYDLLAKTERIVFERLAIINGTFGIEVACAVACDERIDGWQVLDAIAGLVDKSLLVSIETDRTESGERTFRMLDSMRAFAAHLEPRERADDDREASLVRLGRHLAERASGVRDAYFAGDEWESLHIDIDNVRGFLHWAVDERHDPELGATVAGLLIPNWGRLALHAEGLRWIHASLAALPPRPIDRNAQIDTLHAAAFLHRRLLQWGEAFDVAARAYALATACGDDAYRARSALVLAHAAAICGDHVVARERLDEAMVWYDAHATDPMRALALSHAAYVAVRAQNFDDSRRYYEDAIALYRARGGRRQAAAALADLAEMERSLGNLPAAVKAGRAAVEALREFGDTTVFGIVLTNVAGYLVDSEAFDDAASLACEALAIHLRGNATIALALALGICARVAALRDDRIEDAAELFGFMRGTLENAKLEPNDRNAYEHLRSLVEGKLSPSRMDEALARGARLDDDDAVLLALAAVGTAQTH